MKIVLKKYKLKEYQEFDKLFKIYLKLLFIIINI